MSKVNFSSLLRNSLVVLGSILIVTTVVYAATTIGTSIDTTGNLTVSGNATVSGNSTLGDAVTDVNLFTGTLQASTTALFTGPAIFYNTSAFNSSVTFGSNATFTTVTSTSATTSDYFMVGRGTPSPSFNYKGDAWVKDALEVGGAATSSKNIVLGSQNTATTTVTFGGAGVANGAGGICLKFRWNGAWRYCTLNAAGSALACSATSCRQ